MPATTNWPHVEKEGVGGGGESGGGTAKLVKM